MEFFPLCIVGKLLTLTPQTSKSLPKKNPIMAKLKLEYIWLDGYTPLASLRSKTKIIEGDAAKLKLADCPMWGFDGSSTQQAEGKKSDCLLKPVSLHPDTTKRNGF